MSAHDALTFIEHTALTKRSVHFTVGEWEICAAPHRAWFGTFVQYTLVEPGERPRRIPRALALELVQEPMP